MKLKFCLLNTLLCFAFSSVWAVPAKPGVWRSITLVDGSEVRAHLVGDEFLHYYVSEDGTKYSLDAQTGLYTKVQDEAAMQRQSSMRRAMIQHLQHLRKPGMRKSVDQGNNMFSGKKKGLIILAEFTDKQFRTGHDQALYNRMANEEGFSEEGNHGSVKDYFRDQSQGQFELDFDVVGICPLSQKCSYYGGNDRYGNDLHPGAMVAEACLWAHDQGVDFSQYDWDGDGKVDQVFVLYAGKGEADSGITSTIWPHMYTLTESDYGKALTLDGVQVDTYACSSELDAEGGLDGIGTFCHEFSHCMGFPDLYDTAYSGWFGMGAFDLMCSGSYNGNGACPAGYSAYEKAVCGWIDLKDMTQVNEAQTFSEIKPISEGGEAYIVYNKADENEFYIVENRQNTNWDAEIPDAGIMITHVDYNPYVWEWNVPNTKAEYYDDNDVKYVNNHQRLTIFHADNKSHSIYDYGHIGCLYGNGKTKLTANSKPAATLYNMNEDGSYNMHVDITDMQVEDGLASVTFAKASSGGNSDPDKPVVPSGSTLLYESFDQCYGTGGNDDHWNGNISTALVKTSDLDNEGWTSTGKIFKGDGCVRVGTANDPGDITTPSFTVNGTASLTFKAGAWNHAKDGTKLSLSIDDDGSLSKSSVTMKKGEWTQFGATIYANGTARITFTADKGRFFLDEVQVVDNTVDGIEEIKLDEKSPVVGYYTLDGIRLSAPRPGVCLVRYANGTVHKVYIP